MSGDEVVLLLASGAIAPPLRPSALVACGGIARLREPTVRRAVTVSARVVPRHRRGGLRRNDAGGVGGVIPAASSGGFA